MKIAKNINQKLKHVDIKDRVYMYDAGIIIEFLNRTFMPLPYFVKSESLPLIGASVSPRMEHMKDPKKFLDQFMSVGKIYDFYLMFRQQMDFTTPVETRWRFGLIMKKLLYSKNGWQFSIKRVGRAQIWHAGPVMLRVQASVEDRQNFAVAKTNVLAGQVESSVEDLNGIEEDDMTPVFKDRDEEAFAMLNNGTTVHYVKEEEVLPANEDPTLM